MITSAGNEKIKHARSLLQQSKARERHRQFVIEGPRLIEEAERAGFVPALLFCTETFLASAEGQRWAGLWPAAVEPVADHVLAALADTVTPQGVLAVVPQPALVPAKRELLLILDGVRDPGNAGTLLRAALAAGVDEVLMGPGAADPYNPKAVRAAMGAHFYLPLRADLGWDAISAQTAGLDVLLADAGGSLPYDQWDWLRPSALVIGGEAAGAGQEALALASQRVSIPMRPESESLNAAIAGSVILFEAARQRRSLRT